MIAFSSCGNKIQNNSSEIPTASGGNDSSQNEPAENADTSSEVSDAPEEGSAADEGGSGILVAYFSFPENGTDADAGASRVVTEDGEVQGNVEYFARIIAEETGADLFRIETAEQYPGTHEPLVDKAAEERDSGARPELAAHIENLDDYDTVFIGYPIWWYDMPMAMNTFFEEYDLGGKTIVPFSSHGGSGFSTSIDDIASYEPDAEILEGFTVSRDEVPDSADDLRAWIAGLGI